MNKKVGKLYCPLTFPISRKAIFLNNEWMCIVEICASVCGGRWKGNCHHYQSSIWQFPPIECIEFDRRLGTTQINYTSTTVDNLHLLNVQYVAPLQMSFAEKPFNWIVWTLWAFWPVVESLTATTFTCGKLQIYGKFTTNTIDFRSILHSPNTLPLRWSSGICFYSKSLVKPRYFLVFSRDNDLRFERRRVENQQTDGFSKTKEKQSSNSGSEKLLPLF